nr:YggT family protein [Garicola koreensis]
MLTIYQYALIIRIIFNITESFARHWKPKGLVLVLAVGIYSITDPPMRWLQGRIPPLNLGGVSLDMGFIILFLVVIIGKVVVASIGGA